MSQLPSNQAASDSGAPKHIKRRTPLAVRGEPMLWLTGMALTACIVMIVALLSIVLWNGFATFWPRDIHEVRLDDGTTFLGVPTRAESYDPGADRIADIRAYSDSIPFGALDEEGFPVRRLYRVGNKEVTGQPFRWVDLMDIESTEEPTDVVLLERTEWGVWLGRPEALIYKIEKVIPVPEGGVEAIELEGTTDSDWGTRPFEREIIRETDEGVRVIEQIFITDTTEETFDALSEMHQDATKRRARIRALNKHDVGYINMRMERARLRHREVEMLHEEGKASDERLAEETERFNVRQAELELEYQELLEQIRALEEIDDRYRIIVRDPTSGAFAPRAQTEPNEPLRLSQIVRVVRANDLGIGGRLGVYMSRWWEFLSEDPREANTEGGVFPVIFGTVMLTILLSIIVVPFGVIAALYLREYAAQGIVISTVRIAINNLAGVPSIVYGVFGLGFFCYTLGNYIDNGPTNPWSPGMWWVGSVGTLVILAAAAIIGAFARPTPGQPPTKRDKILGAGAMALWLSTLLLFIALIAKSPFFDGFFPARTTFGTKGILWSALTLALLTLPVVVVATEEAISSVPGSLREGSYGCGASKWQTIRRIVLPSAMPGIMTGMILAIARGAGEVAPLMLVGAVKLAPELPFEPYFPYFHLERSFMHLGFHIYDVGFQSPDSEAARPVVWTTTFLLIVVVVTLNLAAIAFRARLRKRTRGGAF